MTPRRRAKLLVLCLAIGSIANLLVAWIAVSDDAAFAFATGDALNETEAASIWAHYARRDHTPSVFEGQIFRRRGVDEIVVFPYDPNASLDHGGVTDWVVEWQCGWPLKSFRTGADFLPAERQFRTAVMNPKPFQFVGVGLGEILPYGLVFPGVLVNTIFYAGIAWLAIRGPAETRRRWRELKGKCGWCAAPRAGVVCAGCGSNLSHAWGSAAVTPPIEAQG